MRQCLRISYYTAIRVPQSIENLRLQRLVKRGAFRAEDLTRLEVGALSVLRAFDRGEADIENVLSSVLAYNAILVHEQPYDEVRGSPKLKELEERYRRKLADRPWKTCQCAICVNASIDVANFRASNRNKRRGIHNLHIFRNLLNGLAQGGQQ